MPAALRALLRRARSVEVSGMAMQWMGDGRGSRERLPRRGSQTANSNSVLIGNLLFYDFNSLRLRGKHSRPFSAA